MRIEQFYFFVEAAKQKSLRLAAEKLYVTPQYISKALHQLEDELNVKLFTRTRYGIKLTDQGETAYKIINNILNEINVLQNAFNKQEDSPDTIDLNILSSADFAPFITDNINILKESCSNLIVDMDIKEASDILILLSSKEYDLAFTCVKSADNIPKDLLDIYRFIPLLDDRLGVFLDKSSPLFSKQSLPVKNLETFPISVFATNSSCIPLYIKLINEFGAYPQISFTSSSPQNCTSYSRKNNTYNIGTKFLTNTIYRERAEVFRFIPFAENITLIHGVFINQNISSDSAILNFIKQIEQHLINIKLKTTL